MRLYKKPSLFKEVVIEGNPSSVDKAIILKALEVYLRPEAAGGKARTRLLGQREPNASEKRSWKFRRAFSNKLPSK